MKFKTCYLFNILIVLLYTYDIEPTSAQSTFTQTHTITKNTQDNLLKNNRSIVVQSIEFIKAQERKALKREQEIKAKEAQKKGIALLILLIILSGFGVWFWQKRSKK